MSIEVQHLTKRYGEQLAVNDISFSVKKGEIVGFLGPNGAGKSTTMKILTCFIPQTEGKAEICGFDTADKSLEVRRRVGYLPEHNPLYLEMYVQEYLRFAAELGGVKKVKQRVSEVIALTRLEREQHKKLKQLSKGYRQRVGLAQAIIHNPEVLILDEPTSGLDPNQVMDIRDLIRNLGMEKTILLSTHIMQEVEAVCDRVIIIDRGRIAADDTLENLRKKGGSGQSIRIQFAGPIDEKALQALPGLAAAQKTGEYSWKLESADPAFRQTVSQFALSHNYEVLELASDKNSLEDIFRNLTGHVGSV